MLWHISLRPAFFPNIRAGVVLFLSGRDRRAKGAFTYFGILQSLEKGRDPHKPVVVVPHHGLSLFIIWHLEGVLED